MKYIITIKKEYPVKPERTYPDSEEIYSQRIDSDNEDFLIDVIRAVNGEVTE